MRKLFLLRHAEAEDRIPDSLRRLTRRGEQAVIDLANFIDGRVKFEIDAIWHSPLTRAVQTAALFKETTGVRADLFEKEGLLPMDRPQAILQEIEEASGNLLLVGHNPHFEALVAEMMGVSALRVPVNVPKASLLRLKRCGSEWQLRDLITTRVSGSIG